jgi:YlmC/YmxH family sporulation protein
MLQKDMKILERNGIQPPISNATRIVELRQKEVINLTDGRRLGFVKDVEFSLESGKLLSIILPGPWSFFRFFGRETEFVIPWKDVRKIGEEIILVDLKDV